MSSAHPLGQEWHGQDTNPWPVDHSAVTGADELTDAEILDQLSLVVVLDAMGKRPTSLEVAEGIRECARYLLEREHEHRASKPWYDPDDWSPQ